MILPKRKPTRLKEYDYSSNGYYFVTVCTHKRKKTLSKIIVGQGLAPAVVQLTQYGKIAETELMRLETAYSCVKIDKYVIMPNHIHAIIVISNDAAGASPCPTLSDVVCRFKSLTVRQGKQMGEYDKIFQTSFYDHIILNERNVGRIGITLTEIQTNR